LGEALAQAGFAVATGGYGGVMEAVSRGASQAGGRVLGVLSGSLAGKCNQWVTEQITVETWEQRLFRLIAVGDGYVACPGGTGTLVELAVVWEMMNKRILPRKPLVALGDFWRPVVEHVEATEPGAQGIVRLAGQIPAAVEFLCASLTAAGSGTADPSSPCSSG
jgi:hypothetical protein